MVNGCSVNPQAQRLQALDNESKLCSAIVSRVSGSTSHQQGPYPPEFDTVVQQTRQAGGGRPYLERLYDLSRILNKA